MDEHFRSPEELFRDIQIGQQSFPEFIGALFRIVGNSFPGLASAAQAWNEYNSLVQAERLRDLFIRFGIEFDAIARQVHEVRDKVCEPSECIHLFQVAMDKAKETARSEKRHRFARILARSLANLPRATLDDREQFFLTESLLSEQDVRVLAFFPRGQIRQVQELVPNVAGWLIPPSRQNATGILAQSLSKLSYLGVLAETWSGQAMSSRASAGPVDAWWNRWEAKYFELLPYGTQFVEFVEESGREQQETGRHE